MRNSLFNPARLCALISEALYFRIEETNKKCFDAEEECER